MPIHPRGTRTPADRTDIADLFGHDALIVNSVFKSRASQSLDGYIHISSVLGYSKNGRHSR
jgi:hypothetical protein